MLGVAVLLLARPPAAEPHLPPPGRALEFRAERAGHLTDIRVVPRAPRAGERAEIVVAIREGETGRPYRGYLTLLVAPPAGEAGPLTIPREFAPGQFETDHRFEEAGVHTLSVVIQVEGTEERLGPFRIPVGPPSRLGEGIAIGLAVLTVGTYAAAFRHARRRAPPGGGDG